MLCQTTHSLAILNTVHTNKLQPRYSIIHVYTCRFFSLWFPHSWACCPASGRWHYSSPVHWSGTQAQSTAGQTWPVASWRQAGGCVSVLPGQCAAQTGHTRWQTGRTGSVETQQRRATCGPGPGGCCSQCSWWEQQSAASTRDSSGSHPSLCLGRSWSKHKFIALWIHWLSMCELLHVRTIIFSLTV